MAQSYIAKIIEYQNKCITEVNTKFYWKRNSAEEKVPDFVEIK